MPGTEHSPREEYAGPAEVVGGDEPIAVEVQLRGHLEPIDGLFHWFGRIAKNPQLDTRHRSGSTVVLKTPHGRSEGRLSDVDTWGRFRISGTGEPPF